MTINKLWIISQNSYAPYMNAGTRHYGIGKELVKKGIKVQLFTSSFNHKTLKETRKYKGLQLYQRELIDGVEFVWIRTLSYRQNDGLDRILSMVLFAITVSFICLLYPRFKKPSAVLGSSPTLIPAFAASCIAWLVRTPFIFEIRDLWPQTIIDFHPEKAGHPMIRLFFWMERFCLKRASRIAGLLPGIPLYLKKMYGKRFESSFFWLPNGVDAAQLSEDIKINESCKIIVYTGALSKANAMSSLLHVAKRCPEFEFHFYGSGTSKNELIILSKSMNLINVTFHEPVQKKDIYGVLNNADILIATLKDSDLYKYGISLNKLYDYMAVGKPIVFGANAYNDPVSEAKAGITVPPEDDEAMADSIWKIAKLTQSERKNLGTNGKEFLKRNHTFEILANRLLKELRLLV